MNGRETAIEATLLFSRPPRPDLPALAPRVEAHCRQLAPGIGLRPAGPDHMALAGSCASVVISSSGPLDVGQFLLARRPENAALSATEASLRLIGHCAALSIRAAGAGREKALCLCYASTAALVSATDPDLIHWSASNTLYALPEFLATAGATDVSASIRPAARRLSPMRHSPAAFRPRLPFNPEAQAAPPPHRANRVQRPIVHRQRRDDLEISRNNARYSALLFPHS